MRFIVASISSLILFLFAFQYCLAGGYSYSLNLLADLPTGVQRPFKAIQTSRYAFAVFLDHNDKSPEEDVYFIGSRMLAYQLLHDPETKTLLPGTPFIVMVSANVTQAKRQRLELDGAKVIEVAHITSDWIHPASSRWNNLMDKLNVLTLTQFDRVVMLDTDVVIVRRMDGIFDDPAVKEEAIPLNREGQTRLDEGPIPHSYVMAANSENLAEPHPYPAPRGDRMNAGLMIVKPSLDAFQYYLSVLSIKDRFNSVYCEQALFNYVHRRSGNLPWKQIHHRWTINHPTFSDYRAGVSAIHAKFWNCRDSMLRDVLLKSRWMMEGYWTAR